MKALKKGKVYQSRGKRSHFSFWHGKGIKDTFKLNVEMTALPCPGSKGHSTQRLERVVHTKEVYAYSHGWVHMAGWCVQKRQVLYSV